MRRLLVRNVGRARLGFFLATFVALGTGGCAINPEAGTRQNQLGIASCAESKKTFDATGAAEPNLFLSQLPAGIYTHQSAEVYFENTLALTSGSAPRVARVQFRETSSGTTASSYVTSIRCRETENGFSSLTAMAPMISDFTKFDTAARGYDTSSNSYALNFATELTPALTVSDAGDLRNASSGAISGLISGYWTGGYHFVRRTGEIYEFFGVRDEGGRLVLGKAVYLRSPLPSGSL